MRPVQLGFIVGVPRSGTTLVSAILNRHPLMGVTPETHFFSIIFGDSEIREALINDLPDGLQRFFERLDSIRRDKHQNWAPTIPEIVARCNGDSRPAAVFEAFCSLLADSQGDAQLILEKTPSHLLHADALRAIFPTAPIIHVIRDGRDVASSLSRVYWGTDNYFANLSSWANRLEKGIELLDGDSNTICVRYEDLLQYPMATAKRLIEFLDFDFSENLLSPDGSELFLIEADSKHKEKVTQKIDPNNAFKWRRDLSEKETIAARLLAGKQLRAAGYDCYAGTREFHASPRLVDEIIAKGKAVEFFIHAHEKLGDCSYGGVATLNEAAVMQSKGYFFDNLLHTFDYDSQSLLGSSVKLIRIIGRLARMRWSTRLIWVLLDDDIVRQGWKYQRVANQIAGWLAHEIVIANLSEIQIEKFLKRSWLIAQTKRISCI